MAVEINQFPSLPFICSLGDPQALGTREVLGHYLLPSALQTGAPGRRVGGPSSVSSCLCSVLISPVSFLSCRTGLLTASELVPNISP